MICRRCGKEIKKQSKFCPKCGAKIYEEMNQEEGKEIHVDSPTDDSFPKKIKQENKETPYKLSVPNRILSVVICIIVVVLTVLSSIVCVGRIGMQKEKIKETITNEDILEIRINDYYLSYFIVSHINLSITKKYNINTSQVDEILGNKQVSEMITNLVYDYIAMFIFGEKPINLNEDTILKNIKSLDNLVFSKVGYHFTEQDYADIKKELTSGNLSFLIEDNLKTSVGADPYLISMLFSVPAICIYIALLLIVLAKHI